MGSHKRTRLSYPHGREIRLDLILASILVLVFYGVLVGQLSVRDALSFLLGLMVGALASQPDPSSSSGHSYNRGPQASLRSSELLGIPQTANRPAEQVC